MKDTPGGALSDMRRRVRHKCAWCKTSFVAVKSAVYCSNSCRQKAKYARKKQQQEN